MAPPRDTPIGLHRFGDFELDEADRVLRRGGRRVKLADRGFDVLAALVRNAGKLVTKEDLLRAAWAGRHVEEGNIHVQVSALRKILGHHAISTVPALGYRFELAVFGGTRPPAWTRSNVPIPPGPLVGRLRETVRVEELLEHARAVTLKGPGGIGKTRLALHIGHDLLRHSALRVWFVDLQPATTRESVVLAVLQAIGKMPRAGAAPEQALVARLREAPAVMILDNCEHVGGEAALLVAALLRSCPELRILSTSRHTLGIAGEHVYEVPPLSTSESAELFLARAAAVAPHFRPGEEDRRTIERIMGRLEGLSLAIELAASRMRAVSLRELDALLADRLRALAGNDTSAPERHRSIEATLGWSYGQLDRAQQRLCRRLSVFSGPFGVEDAMAVCAEPDEDRMRVIDLLTALVDRSLIQARPGPGAQQFGQIDLIREYGLAQLEQSGELDAVRLRHAQHYRAVCEAARSARGGLRWLEELTRMRERQPEIHAALRWCLWEGRDPECGAAIAIGAYCYWKDEGLLDDGLYWLEVAMRSSERFAPLVQARLLHAIGGLSKEAGRIEAAEGYLRRSMEALAKLPGARDAWAVSCNELGAACQLLGRHEEARALHRQALEVFREKGTRRCECLALLYLGTVEHALGDVPAAEAWLGESLAIALETGNLRRESESLMELASCALDRGAAGEALSMYQRALEARSPQPEDPVAGALHHRIARCAAATGDLELARRSLTEAAGIPARLADHAATAELVESAVEVAASFGDLALAARLCGFACAWRESRNLPRTPVQARKAERAEETLRAALGKRAFESARRNGAALSLPDALADIRTLAAVLPAPLSLRERGRG